MRMMQFVSRVRVPVLSFMIRIMITHVHARAYENVRIFACAFVDLEVLIMIPITICACSCNYQLALVAFNATDLVSVYQLQPAYYLLRPSAIPEYARAQR